jgi:hypothetical protein
MAARNIRNGVVYPTFNMVPESPLYVDFVYDDIRVF